MSLFESEKTYSYESLPLSDSSADSAATSVGSTSSTARNCISRKRKSCISFLIIAQIVVVGFACYGILMLVDIMLGRVVRVTKSTPEQLKQAGWARQPFKMPTDQTILENSFNMGRVVMHEFPPTSDIHLSKSVNDLHLLILSPFRNAEKNLPTLFELLGLLQHPKENTSLGFLIGDEDDRSSTLLHAFATSTKAREYRQVTLLRKDFNMDIPGGNNRHLSFLQNERRYVSICPDPKFKHMKWTLGQLWPKREHI